MLRHKRIPKWNPGPELGEKRKPCASLRNEGEMGALEGSFVN